MKTVEIIWNKTRSSSWRVRLAAVAIFFFLADISMFSALIGGWIIGALFVPMVLLMDAFVAAWATGIIEVRKRHSTKAYLSYVIIGSFCVIKGGLICAALFVAGILG